MADIIRLHPPQEERDIKRKIGHWCGHKKIGYCLEDRSIWCQECKAQLDPFDAFLGIVREWESWTAWAASRKRDAQKAKTELDDLKRQVANAKAQLKRAIHA